MRTFLLYFFTFAFQIAFSQPDSSKKLSPVTLSNVVISSNSKKIRKVHLRGFPSYNGLSQTNAVVSYVGNLPEGVLRSVSFYFNCGLANHLKKQLNINYKDVQLGLLIYKANPDSTLGDLISQNDILFTVPAEHRGAFKVDLSSLNVQQRSIFIGFNVITQLPKDENNIYVRYNDTKTGRSYVKMNLPFAQQSWQQSSSSASSELKLSLEILE